MKYDVFISYSRKDTAIADKICEAFDKKGISYFIDRQGIGGGMEFPAVLADAILKSKLMLFLASNNSYNSKFTNSEVTYAFNKKPAGTIIPYIIDDSKLPTSLEFTFSSVNIRSIKECPINVLVDDTLKLLGMDSQVRFGNTQDDTSTNTFGQVLHKKWLFVVLAIVVASLLSLLFYQYSMTNSKTESILGLQNDTVLSDSISEEAEKPKTQEFKTKFIMREMGNDECIKVYFPIAGNEQLLRSISSWINRHLEEQGTKYTGDVSNGEEMINYYAKAIPDIINSTSNNSVLMSRIISVFYENQVIVTYEWEWSVNESDHIIKGWTTFSKKDGSEFSIDMIEDKKNLQAIIREEFRKYFGVATNEQLVNKMNSYRDANTHTLPYTLDDVKLPITAPFITKDGVCFCYNNGEFQLYDDTGFSIDINFTIPLSKLEGCLSKEGKNYIQN